MENKAYVKKWLEGKLDADEKKVFEQTDEYRSLERLSKSLMQFKAPEYDVHAEYERLQTRSTPQGNVVSINWLSPLLKIAATAILMVGGYFLFLYNPHTTIETLAAEKTEITLPDASSVTLNAFSQLSFYEKNWNEKREVTLEGEAFFKVSKGSRFDVQTSSGRVSVLGTKFNVINRKDYYEVVCYEGSVQVQTAQQAVTLLPKQMFRIAGGTATQETAPISNAPAWIASESSFQSVPFIFVVREFERQYNVTVIIRNADVNQPFTGTFTHTDRTLALKSITIPFNLSYQIGEDKKIIFTGGNK